MGDAKRARREPQPQPQQEQKQKQFLSDHFVSVRALQVFLTRPPPVFGALGLRETLASFLVVPGIGPTYRRYIGFAPLAPQRQSSAHTFSAAPWSSHRHIPSSRHWPGVQICPLTGRVLFLRVEAAVTRSLCASWRATLQQVDLHKISLPDGLAGLTNMPRLKCLRVFDCAMDSAFQLPQQLAGPSLQRLDISNCPLDGLLPPKLLVRFPKLTHLVLCRNSLSGRLPQDFFATTPRLEILNLAVNDLDGPFPLLPTDARTCLRLFAIQCNNFTGCVPAAITECRQLQMLRLAYNQFNSVAFVAGDRRSGRRKWPLLLSFNANGNRWSSPTLIADRWGMRGQFEIM